MPTIYGTPKADLLPGTTLDDLIYGLAGDDTVSGDAGNDTLYGGIGDDQLDGGEGADILWGGRGRDTLFGSTQDRLYGEEGDDRFLLSSPSRFGSGDRIYAYGGLGDDSFTYSGNAFNYGLRLFRDEGRDTFTFASIQASELNGGAGRDTFDIKTLVSGSISGDAGFDHIMIGNALGTIHGGLGNDEIEIGSAKTGTVVYGDEGNDQISLSVGGAILDGGVGNDTIKGGFDAFATTRMFGGAGQDLLISGRNNITDGGDGRDVLESGANNNHMTGGAGADLFVYGELVQTSSPSSIQADTITDFSVAEHDRLDVSALLAAVGGSNDPFGGGWLSLNHVNGSTEVLFDADGGGDNYRTLVVLQDAIVTQDDFGNLIV